MSWPFRFSYVPEFLGTPNFFRCPVFLKFSSIPAFFGCPAFFWILRLFSVGSEFLDTPHFFKCPIFLEFLGTPEVWGCPVFPDVMLLQNFRAPLSCSNIPLSEFLGLALIFWDVLAFPDFICSKFLGTPNFSNFTCFYDSSVSPHFSDVPLFSGFYVCSVLVQNFWASPIFSNVPFFWNSSVPLKFGDVPFLRMSCFFRISLDPWIVQMSRFLNSSV